MIFLIIVTIFLKFFDDPNEMRNAIIKENEYNNKARLLAGYCWNWDSKKTSITIRHHFSRI